MEIDDECWVVEEMRIPVACPQDPHRTVEDLRLVDTDGMRHAGAEVPEPCRRCNGKYQHQPRQIGDSATRRGDGRRHAGRTVRYHPRMAHAFTIGVEEEFQIVDPDTWELRSHVSELLTASASSLGDQIKRELHQSIVEVGTRICADVTELDHEIVRLRRELSRNAERVGLRIAAAGTHPFSNWKDQIISPGARYESIVEELQQLARSLLIFGLHIHVAVPDRASTIELLNEARYFLPHLLALSTSSPFWQGRDTGLKSYRTTVFRRFPRSGIPDQFNSWSEYEEYLDLLVELHCIDDAKKVWWDIRPHPSFGTLEFRICDVPTSPRATVALAALAQAVVVKLYRLRNRNLGFRIYPRALVEENKWRAARYGIEGSLIDFGKRAEVPMRQLAMELLEFVDDVVDELGSRQALAYVDTILSEGTSADRQLEVYKRTGDLRAVVRWMVDETRAGQKEVA
jgi:carboxylate-amine ligase